MCANPNHLEAKSSTLPRLQVLHAGGNALTLVLLALVWVSWRVLADFRDAMLMALLCSVALRDVRNDLVAFWRSWLSADRCAFAYADEVRGIPCLYPVLLIRSERVYFGALTQSLVFP